jgi:hypothetical protein
MTDSKSKPNLEQAAQASPLRWPWWTSLLPPDHPTITIKFDGLLAFCYNSQGGCEVGVLRASLKHRLKIVIKDMDTTVSKEFKNDLTPTSEIRLDVLSPADFLTGARFFRARERREDLNPSDANDKLDFRWMLDLEDHIYDHEVNKIPGCYVPKFQITHGIFRADELTPGKFKLVGKVSGRKRETRQLVDGMAANIYLKAGDGARLTWGGQTETFMAGKKYKIYFTNLCQHDGRLCEFSPHSPYEIERNDFHFYFETFNIDATEEKFMLMMHEPPAVAGTDDAPCGQLGYGRSSGLG